MLFTEDSAKEVIKSEMEVPINLEKILIKINSPINLDLINWEKKGLRIGVSVKGFGRGYFNEEPYPDRETSLREYQHVLTQVRKGNYSLELCRNQTLKLSLINSE